MTHGGDSDLPPAARARIARASADGVRSSLLDIRGGVAVESAGLLPVGEVMGCIVEQISWAGSGYCGYYGYAGRPVGPAQTITSGAAGERWAGFAPYVRALYAGYETSLRRMLLEAQALGADGVIGVSWTEARLEGTYAREFIARGTAVRAVGPDRPSRLFSTDLSGADVTKLLRAGWFPSSLVIGLSVAIRHDDYATRQAASRVSFGNNEVEGYTELVTEVRADARRRFHDRAAKQLGDAAIVSDMALKIWEREPGEGHRDHIAEATVLGNALVRVHTGDRPVSDSQFVLPLRRSLT